MGEFDRFVAAHRARRAANAEEERARQTAARSEAVAVARALAERYALERVVLFGSLARGGFGPRSDIDLAVFGLPEGALVPASVLANAQTSFEVSLVRAEDAPAHIRRAIELEGIVLCRR